MKDNFMLYVVDANVAVKWFLPELFHDKAKKFMIDFVNQDVELIAPDIIVGEVGSTLWKSSVKTRVISVERAGEAFGHFLALRLPLHPTSNIAARALSIAIQEQHPIYDVVYVALAEEKGCEFVTADETLVRKMSSKFKFVRWLGEF